MVSRYLRAVYADISLQAVKRAVGDIVASGDLARPLAVIIGMANRLKLLVLGQLRLWVALELRQPA